MLVKKVNAENLCRILGRVKDMKRVGWLRRNVSASESDGDHSFSVAFMAMILAPDSLNRLHCMELALVHDLQEIYSGDSVPGERPSEQKYSEELLAVERLAEELSFPLLVDWFKEFEAMETPEARFVKSLDKVDCAMMACYYENNNRSPFKLWDEFSTHAVAEIKRCAKDEGKTALTLIEALNKKEKN